jgi:hypothetical protein
MSRIIFTLLVAGLAAAALLVPAPPPVEPGPVASLDSPSVAVCLVEQGSGVDTSVAVTSTVNGTGQFTVFAGRQAAGTASFETGASGSAVVPVVDVAAIGVAAGLVELPNAEAAASSLLTGAELVAQESCVATPSVQTVLAGGFTTNESEFEIRLMNPYAAEATVDLTVRSESGIESAPQLRGISVPSRSTQVVDMDELLPGRESLNTTVDAISGSVMAVGRLQVGAEGAIWNAVTPEVDWFIPAPSGGVGQIVVGTSSSTDVEIQVDVYGTSGLVEAFLETVVPASGEVTIDVETAGVAASAFRVVSAQPVAVFERNIDGTVAYTSASTVASSRWLLPGSGLTPDGTGRMVVLNAGIEDSSVIVTALRDESVAVELPIGGGTVVEHTAVAGSADGYTVRGEGLFVPMWVTTAPTGTAYQLGVPLIDE